ncbi:lysozyme inhibitor LprI family protein [Xanthomonas albilineans]|uniref:lysozyme inhibitor LprI family protein n=1 Tax=Xanthomonas albilineans TaxID=29447 RepID=UPI000AAE3684|nr:lysozyme inhibitor LprI family protein [Xanthomonas albilineans]
MRNSNAIARHRVVWAFIFMTVSACGTAAAQQSAAQAQALLLQQTQQIQQMQQQMQQVQTEQASNGLSAAYLECRKQATGLDERRRCIQREQRVQQDRLDRAYDTLRYRLSGSDRTKLIDAQYTWQQSNAQGEALDKALSRRSQEATLQNAEANLRRIGARADQLEGYARSGH